MTGQVPPPSARSDSWSVVRWADTPAALIAVVGFWCAGGAPAAASAAVGAAGALVFYIVGLAVQVAVADAPPGRVLAATMISYASRVSILGVGIWWLAAWEPSRVLLQPVPVVVATIAVVFGWLGAELWVFSRLRIPVFDPPETPRDDPSSQVSGG